MVTIQNNAQIYKLLQQYDSTKVLNLTVKRGRPKNHVVYDTVVANADEGIAGSQSASCIINYADPVVYDLSPPPVYAVDGEGTVFASQNSYFATQESKYDAANQKGMGIPDLNEANNVDMNFNMGVADFNMMEEMRRKEQAEIAERIEEMRQERMDPLLHCEGDTDIEDLFVTEEVEDAAGLLKAISTVFPSCPQRYCLRHIYANFQAAGFRGEDLKKYMDATSYAFHKDQFDVAMENLKTKSEDQPSEGDHHAAGPSAAASEAPAPQAHAAQAPAPRASAAQAPAPRAPAPQAPAAQATRQASAPQAPAAQATRLASASQPAPSTTFVPRSQFIPPRQATTDGQEPGPAYKKTRTRGYFNCGYAADGEEGGST
ncbi:hypothetical protein ACQ4PT_037152 [Festuca glaucescens]